MIEYEKECFDRYAEDMTDEEYHADPALSSSMIRYLAKEGSYRYWAKFIAKTIPDKDTDALRFGRLFHRRMQFPNSWALGLYRVQKCDARTKAGKLIIEKSIEAVNSGMTLIDESDVATLDAMYDAVMEHPGCRELLEMQGVAESSWFAQCRYTGMEVKARPDWMLPHTLVDFKTTEALTQREFERNVLEYGYDCQADWYMRVTGVPAFAVVAITKKAPHEAHLYEFDEEMLWTANQMNTVHLNHLKSAREFNQWHSEGWGTPHPIPLSVKRW